MKITEFKQRLEEHVDKPVGFVFDDGEFVPPHFHITEVGHVVKNFIDCGGTVRRAASVQLQVWLGDDEHHRLTAGKLAKIIELAKPLIPSEDLDIEIEYEGCVISQYTLESASVIDGQVVFRLADKHTDCLAKESCGIEVAGAARETSGCCGGSSSCC
ncbi:MAG TPA: DUF6428 family protein [Opitutaceae bacterium]|nr:DUF6428 family protein [Opitutaceae bacterium]